MPVSYRVDPDQRVVHTIFEGEVTDQQIVDHAEKIQSDSVIDGSFVELIRAKTESMEKVTGRGVRAVAEALRASNAVRRIGIVASQEVEFGLARMAQLLADGSQTEIQVFREEADARSWLGIP